MKQSQTAPFRCSKLNGVCQITHEFVEHRSRRSAHEPAHRAVSRIDCDSTRECGVEDARGNFNWTLCVHPDIRKRAS